MILKAGEGGWIIINDRIFTTLNKENKTLQLHPPSDFFPFFSANSCCFSFIITPDFWSCNHVFIASFQREQLALWKDRKKPHHPLKNWKEIGHQNQNMAVFFLRFYCKSVGICILELMH
jgi:hypothetical protein